jgi:heme oxygenase
MTDTELLEQIVNRLDRIEEMLENGIQNNKTLEIKETRQLMQDLVKYYKDTEPSIDIQIGTKLHVFRFRDTVAKVKNIKNSKLEHRRMMKYLRKLEECQFISKINADMFEVLDTGKDWWESS